MDKFKVQDFASSINHLSWKTLSFSVLKSSLKYISFSLFRCLEACTPLLETIYKALKRSQLLEPPIPLIKWA